MWLAFGIVVATLAWLLTMVAVWGLLYGHDGRRDDSGAASRQ